MMGSHHHPRVLLVEDDPFVGAMLRDMLEDADFEVDGPHISLGEGVAALADHLPDFALLDIRLGKADVAMLADDLKQYGVGFAFCSGLTPDRDMRRSFPEAPFLTKPIDCPRLLRTINDNIA